MASNQQVLEQAAQDGSIDSNRWPEVLPFVLERINQSICHDFPIPQESLRPRATAATNESTSTLPDGADRIVPSSVETQGSDPIPSTPPRPTALEPTTTKNDTPPQPHQDDQVLPPALNAKYDFIKDSLSNQFAKQPPHTIQRLSELVLQPKRHYRSLFAFMNALDRIVSVSTGSDAFPLPIIEPIGGNGPLVNGTHASIASRNPNSEESLGGALLTPIPWLRDHGSSTSSGRRRSSGHSDEASMETEGVEAHAATQDSLHNTGPVTQGELLRKEQETSAPPAPVAALSGRPGSTPIHGAEDSKVEGEIVVEEPEQPHARGPDTIGPEDTGPQDHALGSGQVLDMEAAVGRSRSPQPPSKSEEAKSEKEDKRQVQSGHGTSKDQDGDVVLADVDGVTEDDEKMHDASGDNTAPDAIDTTAR